MLYYITCNAKNQMSQTKKTNTEFLYIVNIINIKRSTHDKNYVTICEF